MKRRKIVSRKKIFATLTFWLIFFGYINLFPPESRLSFLAFYLLLSASFLFTFLLFSSVVQSLERTIIVIIFLLLRQFQLENILNIIILIGIAITLEMYFRKN